MQRDLRKRVENLKEKVNGNFTVLIKYKDGTKTIMSIVEALVFLIYSPENVEDVDLIGDTTNQGILPDLVNYLADNNAL